MPCLGKGTLGSFAQHGESDKPLSQLCVLGIPGAVPVEFLG